MKAFSVAAVLLFASLLTACGEQPDKPEIKQCSDAGGIPVRNAFDLRLLKTCIFPPQENTP